MDLMLFILEFRATGTTILVKHLLHVYMQASLGVVVRELAMDYRPLSHDRDRPSDANTHAGMIW